MAQFRKTAYQAALRVMFRLEPERIHGIVHGALGIFSKLGPLNRAFGRLIAVNDPILAQEVLGCQIPRPLGVAAGFDKDGTALEAWSPLGFGYAEIGTVTAQAQLGNPTPRLFRLKADKALLNRMGFNNPGAEAVAKRLRNRRYSQDIVAINIGKTKVVPASEAVADYRRSARLLAHLANFVVVNVSSPNTPGLRDLQAVESLRPILKAVQEEAGEVPVLVKIAPDLSDTDIDAVADLAVELQLAGIVATNTTISREGLKTPAAAVYSLGAGGISGPPIAKRSLEVLRRLYDRVGDQLVLVASGGITTPEEAWERITSGASLLQGYTGFIYLGPDWIRDIHKGIATQLRRHGMTSIKQAVGSGAAWLP
ncbi:quinone-dependent dihydroorotate dehydrogenase [Corynebacterium caspium]|uniref:quinone-dependent dihydroorotate dehydrogenase n=1 Tax=Corynebacterium caspium TaxID=234828 RepID=UPI000369EA57|nr:quinone-dependent dihydroorotate dehydrogenase [Corynebacterium caspium]WKD59284.1 Dihydroorotate dehydrogenase (quinone) [Corynebacterium caspium DSM 44850]